MVSSKGRTESGAGEERDQEGERTRTRETGQRCLDSTLTAVSQGEKSTRKFLEGGADGPVV